MIKNTINSKGWPQAVAGTVPARKTSNRQSQGVKKPTPSDIQPAPAPGHFLSVKEVAAMLGVGRHRLSRALRAKQINSVKIGSRFMIRVADAKRVLGE